MKILINCGHTLIGGDSNGKEGKLNRDIGNLVMKKLMGLGHTIVNCTCDSAISETSAINYIVNKANATGGDLFMSIHHNAGTATKHGTEILTMHAKTNAYTLNILKQMEGIGYQNRGVQDGSNLGVIHRTNAPAMLIEVCFMDWAEDMQLWNAEKISDCITKGIDAKYQPIVKPQPVPTKKTQPTTKITDSTTKDVQPVKNMSIGLWALVGIIAIGIIGKNKI